MSSDEYVVYQQKKLDNLKKLNWSFPYVKHHESCIKHNARNLSGLFQLRLVYVTYYMRRNSL